MAIDKSVDSTVLDGYFGDIADAIRAKNGGSDTYTPGQMPQAIANIPSGGGDTLADVILKKTQTSYSNSEVLSIPEYAFASCSQLTSVSFANAQTVGNYAFTGCSALPAISFPKLTSLGSYSFQNCTALESLSLPLLQSGGNYAFSNTGIKDLSLSALKSVSNGMFNNCSNLRSIYLPAAESIGQNAFSGLNGTGTDEIVVNLPAAKSLGGGMFSGSTKIKHFVVASTVTTLSGSAFNGANGLIDVTFAGQAPSFSANYIFAGNTALECIDFSNCVSVPYLSTVNAFYNLPAGCVFVVPDALYDTWVAASNWTTFASRIVKSSVYFA